MNQNNYKHPHPGLLGRLAELLANSHALANVRLALMSRLPFLKLESDVSNVVYLTWLVDAEAAQAFVPAGARLWQRDGKTPFTVLTYRHGHFGPAMLGPLRKLFPSPMQSNWRLYLEEAPHQATQARTVLFLKNIMSSVAYALGTRLFSDALPSHLAASFIHCGDGKTFDTTIGSGSGSAPSLSCSARLADGKELSEPFASAFGSWENAVEFLCCQDAAVAHVDRLDRLAFAEIELPIDVARVLPLNASAAATQCSFLAALPPAGAPLCFLVPQVKFLAVSERLL
ncbi:hypothetical protein ACFDR9_000926 [Janthinobacterium sp. CG_23.3]|uniref:DUF2071 domain-containing protein n=1 Tax=Janthinobacterium sp. CG_23.3 TaxID=3349634 RepID=UPI0038D50B6E